MITLVILFLFALLLACWRTVLSCDFGVTQFVAAKILDSVRYLHINDIVHRDIKPENLIFDRVGDMAQLKLTDFGFATMYDRTNPLTATCGTPEYVAPEVLEGKSYNSQVDVWSCGVVIYILLCGFPPFYGDTEEQLFDRICTARLANT
jgi:serine/threonine protein kinase